MILDHLTASVSSRTISPISFYSNRKVNEMSNFIFRILTALKRTDDEPIIINEPMAKKAKSPPESTFFCNFFNDRFLIFDVFSHLSQ
jgi:hypothetical protein